MNKNKFVKLMACAFMAAAMMTCLSGMAAYAANTVTSVSIAVTPDVLDLEPGEMAPAADPVLNSSNVFIEKCQIDGKTDQEMTSFYYNLTLRTENGYLFGDKLSVNAKGASGVTVRTLSDEKAEVRIKCYPYWRLDNPSSIEDDGSGYTWRKVRHAKKYNVVFTYEDEDGNEKNGKKTVDSNRIDLEKYMEDGEILSVSVQAAPGSSSEEWKYLLPSEYVNQDNDVDSEQSNVIKSFSYPSASGSKERNKTSGGHASATMNNPAVQAGANTTSGFISTPNGTWFRNPDGSWPANAWQFINNEWYFFNDGGYRVENQWILWSNVWYYLGKNGVMMKNGWTPDGCYVNEAGAWVPGYAK